MIPRLSCRAPQASSHLNYPPVRSHTCGKQSTHSPPTSLASTSPFSHSSAPLSSSSSSNSIRLSPLLALKYTIAAHGEFTTGDSLALLSLGGSLTEGSQATSRSKLAIGSGEVAAERDEAVVTAGEQERSFWTLEDRWPRASRPRIQAHYNTPLHLATSFVHLSPLFVEGTASFHPSHPRLRAQLPSRTLVGRREMATTTDRNESSGSGFELEDVAARSASRRSYGGPDGGSGGSYAGEGTDFWT